MANDKTAEQLFAQALAAFQQDLPAIRKDNTATVRSDKGNYSYAYADLTDISEAAMPLLAKQGLSFSATPTMTDHGFVLRYALIHEGGHREGGDFPLPDASKFGAQQIGSWLTYARRYALCAVTGLAPGGDDDDGEKAKDARASDPLPRAPRTRGATTRHTAETLPREDDWSTPAPEAKTDEKWIKDFRERLVRCGDVAEMDKFDDEARDIFHKSRLTVDDARALREEVAQRKADLQAEAAS